MEEPLGDYQMKCVGLLAQVEDLINEKPIEEREKYWMVFCADLCFIIGLLCNPETYRLYLQASQIKDEILVGRRIIE